MTNEEVELKIQFVGEYDRQREAKDMAIKALEQEPSEDCISRQAVLDLVVANHTELNGVNVVMYSPLCKDIKQLPFVTPQQLKTEWTPVSERLPDVNEEVLLTICNNSALQGFNKNFVNVKCGKYQPYRHKMDWVVDGVRYHFDNVIAWQPKPEPYKMESEE